MEDNIFMQMNQIGILIMILAKILSQILKQLPKSFNFTGFVVSTISAAL